MQYNYKDLMYLLAALNNYESTLQKTSESDVDEDEFSEIQDDIMYVSRLTALTEKMIEEWENRGPSLNPVSE